MRFSVGIWDNLEQLSILMVLTFSTAVADARNYLVSLCLVATNLGGVDGRSAGGFSPFV
jgi:hypothetical protein